MRILLPILFLGISFISKAQEFGMLVAGINVLPLENVVIGGKLAYYRPGNNGQLYGVKVAAFTNALAAGQYDVRFRTSSLDVVRRWTIGRQHKNKTRWWFDGGLSVMESTEITPPQRLSTFFDCGVGMTEQAIQELTEYYSKTHIHKSFYPGLALAFNWEFRLAKNFYLGIDLPVNVYYSFEDEAIYPCPVPFITASIPFKKGAKDAGGNHKNAF